MKLNDNVTLINGVGPKYASLLSKIGINTIHDMLYHIPAYYKDYSSVIHVSNINTQDTGLFCVKVLTEPVTNHIRKNLTKTNFSVSDDDFIIDITVFNQIYFRQYIKEGNIIYLYGRIDYKKGKFSMVSPEIFFSRPEKYKPVYHTTSGLSQNIIHRIIINALKETCIEEKYSDKFINDFKLMPLKTALEILHLPNDYSAVENARSRLVFDEFIDYLTILDNFSIRTKSEKIFLKNDLQECFFDKLQFNLTESQKKVMNEILQDVTSPYYMNRLIQGDVGSGKTIVAFYAMNLASLNGYQSLLMAPTEILAKQHYKKALEYFKGEETVLLTGSLSIKEKRIVYDKISDGTAKYIFGTHALINEKIVFCSLGLIITDEQHRFGVEQRASLTHGINTHTIIMSATPIPRSLAITMYGQTNLSCIDELPPGRVPVKTYVMSYKKIMNLFEFIVRHLINGEQMYFVCPSIQYKENSDLSSVDKTFTIIKKYFNNYRVECLHGNMSKDEKEQIMSDFAHGKINILVSTTVIEVGIDVPSASIMCIMDADRFGLAQLHQLRGRVGRSDIESFCFLITKKSNSLARLKILSETEDGFHIANKDFEIRGSGDITGIRQHGTLSFNIANIYDDAKVLNWAKEVLEEIKRNERYIEDYNKLKYSAEEYYKHNKLRIAFN